MKRNFQCKLFSILYLIRTGYWENVIGLATHMAVISYDFGLYIDAAC